MPFKDTRVTNPTGSLSAAEREKLLRQFAGGGSDRKSNAGKTMAKKKGDPGLPRNSKGQWMSKRKKNPGLPNPTIAGVKAGDALRAVAGVFGGTYVAGAAANAIDSSLISKFGGKAWIRGVLYILGGGVMVGAGWVLQKKFSKFPIPLDYAGVAMSVPFVQKAMTAFGIPGFRSALNGGSSTVAVDTESGEMVETTEMTGTIQRGLGPAMSGTFGVGRAPGMGGSLQPNLMPGTMGAPSMGRARLPRTRMMRTLR